MSLIIGVILSFASAMVGVWISEGANFSLLMYWDLAAFFIVVVASIFLAMAMYSIVDGLMMPLYLLQCLIPLPYKEAEIITTFQRMADKVRGAGIPALTSEIPTAFDEFMRRGIKMVIAGTDSSTVKSIMHEEIARMEKRHKQKISIFNELAGIGPTMGMVGTLLALIIVLGNLEDTSRLGSSIAVALIATLYGVAVANLIFVPIAKSLDIKNEKEVTLKTMIMEGLLSVQAGESSFIVGQRLKAYVNDRTRANIEGGKVGGKKKGEKYVEIATYMNPIDQEKAMAFLAEVKKSLEPRDLGDDDAKNMLAELINEAEDKIIMKDFANEFMKSKLAKKLPKGMKRKKVGGGGKKGKKAKAAVAADDDE